MKDEEQKGQTKKKYNDKIDEAFEKKFFPHTHEKKKQEKAMKDPILFEERLKEKLHKCLTLK